MMVFQNWGEALTTSLLNVWYGVINFVPTLILAIVVFAVGWILAILVEKLVESVFKAIKVDAFLRGAGVEDIVKRSGHNLNSGMFVGDLVRWFVIVVFLMASFEILGLSQVNEFLRQVVNYLPQVIVAVLILMVAAVVASAMQKVVIASARASHIRTAEVLGKITRWVIWIFAILAALVTLGIAPQLIQMIVTAIFAGAALAIGLAFGLGGKSVAEKAIEKATHDLLD